MGGAFYLGAGHTPLGRAVHEGGNREAAAALLVPLAEELLFQLVGPSLVGARRRRQVPNVSTLQHHLHACNSMQVSRVKVNAFKKVFQAQVEYIQHRDYILWPHRHGMLKTAKICMKRPELCIRTAA